MPAALFSGRFDEIQVQLLSPRRGIAEAFGAERYCV